MPSYESRKYRQVIDYLAGFPGADIPRDLIRIALSAQDITLDTSGALDLTKVGGTAQTPADWTAILQSLLKDSKIPVTLQQDANGALYIVLNTDNVGLLKDTKIPQAVEQDTDGAIYALTKDDAMARFKAHSAAIASNEIYFIGTSYYWGLKDLTNDGRIVLDGEIYIFDYLGGNGVIEGNGTIILR